jgi:hypothetical protein
MVNDISLLKIILEKLKEQKGIETNIDSLQATTINDEGYNVSSVSLGFNGGLGLAFKYEKDKGIIGGVAVYNSLNLDINDLDNSKASFLIL